MTTAYNSNSPVFRGPLQLVWNSTSLDKLKACPRSYQYAILGGFSTASDNIHIVFGLAYHKAVEVYHFTKAAGASHEASIRAAVRQALMMTWPDILVSNDPKMKAKSRQNLIRTVVWYLDDFGENDSIKTLILADGSPAVEITFAIELELRTSDGTPYILAGHLDRVGTFMDELYYTDLKTTGAALGEYYFENYSPHNQMSVYSFAGQVHTNLPLKGGIIDAAQVQIGGSRFQRGFINRTPDQLAEWYDDLAYHLSLAETFARSGRWPMNDTACRMCNFKKICAHDPKVRETFLKAQFPTRTINPLEIRT